VCGCCFGDRGGSCHPLGLAMRVTVEIRIGVAMARSSYSGADGMVGTDSFDGFFRSEYGPVLGLAIALCGDRGAAEDLTQEAFAAAERRWKSRQSWFLGSSGCCEQVGVTVAPSDLRGDSVAAYA
jgi:hypothetical protein